MAFTFVSKVPQYVMNRMLSCLETAVREIDEGDNLEKMQEKMLAKYTNLCDHDPGFHMHWYWLKHHAGPLVEQQFTSFVLEGLPTVEKHVPYVQASHRVRVSLPPGGGLDQGSCSWKSPACEASFWKEAASLSPRTWRPNIFFPWAAGAEGAVLDFIWA